MHEFQNAGCMDVIAVISETFDSNRKMMENLNIKREQPTRLDPETVKEYSISLKLSAKIYSDTAMSSSGTRSSTNTLENAST